MSSITQEAFAAGLLETTPPPAGLTAWNGTPTRRYGIYRNNVSAGLTGALASCFPAAERIVGPDFFQAMAQAFFRLHPPRSPLLLAYGDDFPDFVATFEPAQEITYLPDVMRLEVARGHAYHAADAPPLDPQTMAAIDPAKLDNLVLTPHPALSILRSPHPAVTIWSMNADKRPLAAIEPWHGEDALVVRPSMTVDVMTLPPGGAIFLLHLAEGGTLARAAKVAAASAATFDLSTNFLLLLQSGAFTAFAEDHAHDNQTHA